MLVVAGKQGAKISLGTKILKYLSLSTRISKELNAQAKVDTEGVIGAFDNVLDICVWCVCVLIYIFTYIYISIYI